MIDRDHPVDRIDEWRFPFHHSAKSVGYVHLKADGGVTPFYHYRGRFGEGFVRYRHCYDSPNLRFVDYYIRKE